MRPIDFAINSYTYLATSKDGDEGGPFKGGSMINFWRFISCE